MLSHSHCRHYYLYAFCFRSVMYYFLKWKREGRKYFCTNDPELIFSHILEAWQYCTPIAHLDTTWTAGCLLVWGAGASVTIETTGASARRLEASRGGLWRIWKPRERNSQLWLNLYYCKFSTRHKDWTTRHVTDAQCWVWLSDGRWTLRTAESSEAAKPKYPSTAPWEENVTKVAQFMSKGCICCCAEWRSIWSLIAHKLKLLPRFCPNVPRLSTQYKYVCVYE